MSLTGLEIQWHTQNKTLCLKKQLWRSVERLVRQIDFEGTAGAAA